jgi:hypothetical protein
MEKSYEAAAKIQQDRISPGAEERRVSGSATLGSTGLCHSTVSPNLEQARVQSTGRVLGCLAWQVTVAISTPKGSACT